MKQMLFMMSLKALQALLCQITGTCKEFADERDDCPDGICDVAIREVDTLSADEIPAPSLTASAPMTFDLKWDKLNLVMDAIANLAVALRAFLGRSSVG